MNEEEISFKQEESVFKPVREEETGAESVPEYETEPIEEESNMIKKRIQITLHPEELEKIDRISKKRKYSRSGMMGTIIREYKEK